MSRRSTARLALAVSLALAGCTPGEAPEAAAPSGPASAPTRWVAPRAPADATILEAPAVVRAVGATAQVSASVRVRVVRLHVEPGSRVEAGDPIVDVAAPELLDAAATYLGAGRGARAQGERADELDALRAEGIVSRAQVFERRASASELGTARDRAAATLRAAGVEPSAAAGLVRRGHLTLAAPVAGVIAALDARVGEIREPGPLARVVGEAAPRVEVRTSGAWPEADALRFVASDGRSVALAPAALATVVDPADGTLVSWYAPLEPSPLPDGLAGTARLTSAAGVLEVPVTAVAARTGRSEVVRRRDGVSARVAVEVLASSGASALVRGELTEEDRVAADVRALDDRDASEAP
ncbi:MAG: efflux RND transporter periplasmic adaptor subunit [Sandaracinaceae bacterium]|nr:efflux RND transporter periplasmic adaptor subunit [Sandaracinaceae bacterium]